MRQRLLNIFDILLKTFGERHWWPGETPLEIIVGAVLTQNTSWKNVEKAIANLRDGGLLELDRLYRVPDETLAEKIRSSGYYNLKTVRLKNIIKVIYEEFNASIEYLASNCQNTLRERLLAIKGIGEETADSILLYAGGRPLFVVDAYTRRILERHGILGERPSYGDVQRLFMDVLPADAGLYNQYHALIVETGKRFCRKKPHCGQCPLREMPGRNSPGRRSVREATGRQPCSSGKKSSKRGSRKTAAPSS